MSEPGPYGPQGRSAWMDVDWREHQRWVTVGRDVVNVIDLGDPKDETPIVFVHGLSGSWQNWLENIPHFAKRHRVIAMDLPGFGASPMPHDGEITIRGYGDLLDRLLTELDVPGAAVLVGNSMGGFIAAETAISSPERVERLVLVSAAGLSVEHQRFDAGLAALRKLENILTFYGSWIATRSTPLVRRPRSRRGMMWFVVAHPERLPAALVLEQVKGSGKPGFVPALDALTSYPIRDRLPQIQCPTLVVWGTEDSLVPVRDAYEFERLIPHARAIVWEDTGHVPQLERPEGFNRLLERFEAEVASSDEAVTAG